MLKNRLLIIVLVLVSLIPLLDFFQPGLPITHDGQIHVARIASFYQSLSEGNLIPRWAGNLNWGFGHPVLMFVYPLPSYLASFFYFLGFSFIYSTKLVFVLGFLLSGIFMYLWISELWGKEAGFASGLLYMFAPYRFIDLYVRGAIGENFAFIWLPLICWLALKLSKSFNWLYLIGGSFALTALILSHNALSLMFLPIVFGYIAFLFYCSKKKSLFFIRFSLFLILGFLLSAFFWLPALVESKYTLQNIVTKGQIVGFERFSRLIWSSWNYSGTGSFSVQLGVLQWLAIIASPFLIWLFWKKKEKYWIYLLFLLASFCLAIFMMLPISRVIYLNFSLLQKFQFTWRFLALAIVPPTIFIGVVLYLLPKKLKFPAVFLILLVVLMLNKNYWYAKDFIYENESNYTRIYPGTTDTGELAPIWSVRFMEEYPQAPMEVIDGQAEIKAVSRTTTKHEFKVMAKTPARLVENTLYFPGWDVLVDGEATEIEFQDPAHRGLMTFNIAEGEHEIVAQFKETRLRLFADLLSLGTVGFLFIGVVAYNTLRGLSRHKVPKYNKKNRRK